jgi:hypothetical protein
VVSKDHAGVYAVSCMESMQEHRSQQKGTIDRFSAQEKHDLNCALEISQ